jgi:hypothetical protein
MLSPLRSSRGAVSTIQPLTGTRRRVTSRIGNIAAPVGGWNARDSLSMMDPTDAIQLDNFIPDAGGVRLREGFAQHATGVGTYVESLMEYNAPGATPKLKAASVDTIYDVTAASAGSSEVTGLTNGRWQHVMFATSGGNYLVCCNGADDVRNYDGSSWTSPSITNVTSSTLINVAVHFSRLWFVQDNSLDAWYLGTSSISGSATKFPLGSICKLGGELLAIASWTVDGGTGLNDQLVFITTKGEAVVYIGTDPATPSTWALKGVFRIPEPVGHRCVVNIGSDLGLITSQGVVPFSLILPTAQSGAAKVAITDKISKAQREAYEGASASFGWQLIEYPRGGLLIENIPTSERVTAVQFVMNTQTGAWCKFTGINAGCWGPLGDDLYFGGHNGVVYKYGDTFADNGEVINAVSASAFSNLGVPQVKLVKLIRPLITLPDGYNPLIAFRVDYDLGAVTYEATESATEGSLWDEATWDDAEWAVGSIANQRWQSVAVKPGTYISAVLAVAVNDEVRLDAIDLLYQPGSYL